MKTIALLLCVEWSSLLLSCGSGGHGTERITQKSTHESLTIEHSRAPTAELARRSSPWELRASAKAAPGKVPAAVVPPGVSPIVPLSEAALVKDAAGIARRIVLGGGVVLRSFPDGGWAWQIDGRVVRTASVKNGIVAYHCGDDEFACLIQSHGEMFVYRARRLIRIFDQGGQPHLPSRAKIVEGSGLLAVARQQLALAKLTMTQARGGATAGAP